MIFLIYKRSAGETSGNSKEFVAVILWEKSWIVLFLRNFKCKKQAGGETKVQMISPKSGTFFHHPPQPLPTDRCKRIPGRNTKWNSKKYRGKKQRSLLWTNSGYFLRWTFSWKFSFHWTYEQYNLLGGYIYHWYFYHLQ